MQRVLYWACFVGLCLVGAFVGVMAAVAIGGGELNLVTLPVFSAFLCAGAWAGHYVGALFYADRRRRGRFWPILITGFCAAREVAEVVEWSVISRTLPMGADRLGMTIGAVMFFGVLIAWAIAHWFSQERANA